ncbi:MAG: rRNA maturation RNase YbeY [Pseudomonadota bacterium]
MIVDVLIEDDRWEGLDALSNRAAEAVAARFNLAGEMAVLGCDDTRIAQLNGDFRQKPTPTNVLSWPSEDRAPAVAGGTPDAPTDESLGDIAIAYETCLREATEQGKAFDDHVLHLLIHGMLHLLGYDHERDADATVMEGLEVEILGNLGIGDPYSGSH